MPRREYREAQRAVADGRALPLREVFANVRRELGGRFIEVRFRDGSPSARYDLRMVSAKGALVTVSVEAATGQILNIAGC